MVTQRIRIISSIVLSAAIFAGLVELVHPAPKISDYCSQPTCLTAAKDMLVGTSEDYFGGMAPWLIGGFLTGVVSIIISFAFKAKTAILIFEIILTFDFLVYALVQRFYHFFSWHPTQTWIVIFGSIVTLSLILSSPLKSQKR